MGGLTDSTVSVDSTVRDLQKSLQTGPDQLGVEAVALAVRVPGVVVEAGSALLFGHG